MNPPRDLVRRPDRQVSPDLSSLFFKRLVEAWTETPLSNNNLVSLSPLSFC